jgi:hypothetical protein
VALWPEHNEIAFELKVTVGIGVTINVYVLESVPHPFEELTIPVVVVADEIVTDELVDTGFVQLKSFTLLVADNAMLLPAQAVGELLLNITVGLGIAIIETVAVLLPHKFVI